MAPQKRKHHDTGPEPPAPHVATRRSTRQHPDTDEPSNYSLRSGRLRAAAAEDPLDSDVKRPASRGKEGDALKAAIADLDLGTAARQTRSVRYRVAPELPDDDELAAAQPPTPPVHRRRRVVQHKHRAAHLPDSPPRRKRRSSSPERIPAAGATPISRKLTPPSTPRSDRNVDTVVFGNACFKAWYPSYYGKEFVGEVAGANAKIGGGKRGSAMLERLYICPCCFKYSKDLAPWARHVAFCERKGFVPGIKVYTHPRSSGDVRLPGSGVTSAGLVEGDDGSAGEDGGEWSVWEVDGDVEGLFCQNLSLFAKLFLDNKSVFFDVTGFNYFLLVYTPPHADAQTSQPPPSNPLSRPQIVGFFSKEKMSWDNNNLACILVFPPWQRKGLGALLMGVSYEISRREGILGGPEKPISELGRKGYKRFWAGEVARWILELDLPVSAAHASRVTREKERGRGRESEELVVDVEQCSRDTWIVPEDCLAVLRDMGVVEDAGPGPPRGVGVDGVDAPQGKEDGLPLVHRVRIDKAAVRAWARENKIELTKACDPGGFVEGYAIKRVEEHDGEG